MSDKREQFEAWFNKNITESLNTHNAALRGWQAALSQSEPEAKPVTATRADAVNESCVVTTGYTITIDKPEVSQPVAFSNSTAYLYWQEGRRPTKDTLLYESSPDYEALRQRVASFEKLAEDHAQSAESYAEQAKKYFDRCGDLMEDNIRLQSECDVLKTAIFTVCEGFNISADVRKILETAMWSKAK